MVLFAFSLFAGLIIALDATTGTALNNSYAQCSNNEDCQNFHDKLYCYAGMCTDKCPPGYSQQNYGTEPNFQCVCNNAKGFVEDGYFDGTFSGLKIPKCTCSKSYCTVMVYALGIGYTDGLIPNGSPPNCKVKADEVPAPILTEFVFYLVISTMLIFTFINCRSASGVIYDFHRYIWLYCLASIAVIVFVQTVYPFTAGFTRSMAFGVIIHNSAEWNFLLRLHFGKESSVRNCTNMCVMGYYVLMLTAMVIIPAILPLEYLLYIAMVQGGFLDWTLLFFVCVGGRALENEQNWQPILKYCCTNSKSRFINSFGPAAAFHLVTVQVLFVGFVLNNPLLIGAGSLLLVPTFFFYTYWVYGEDRVSLLCGPSLVMNYKKKESEYSSSDFVLTPFTHTTRTVDLLWQGLFRNQSTIPEKDTEAGVTADDENETTQLVESVTKTIVIEDCENFKFGVHDAVSKCACGCLCCTWIPLYWVGAMIIVIFNATMIIYVPSFTGTDGCNSGYDYGVW